MLRKNRQNLIRFERAFLTTLLGVVVQTLFCCDFSLLSKMATTAASPRTPASSERPGAASPIKMNRVQEKEELQHLNDRLAVYIDRVRYLEEDNTKLTAEITMTKSRTKTEVETVKGMFESELADARRLLDETAREKAREQIENRKNAALADDYKKK